MPTHGQRTMERLRPMGAAVLLVFFTMLLLVPTAIALRQNDDASLPACCRIHGKHHCAVMHPATSGHNGGPVLAHVTEKCPNAPASAVGTQGSAYGAAVSTLATAGLTSQPTLLPQGVLQRNGSLDRSNQKRGPPHASS